jgi:hypothetical protein
MRTTSNSDPPSLNGPLALIQRRVRRLPSSAFDPDVTRASESATPARKDRRDIVRWLALVASLLALAVGLVDFSLLVGAVPIPVSGLRAPGQPVSKDTATYAFELDPDGWQARGAAANAISNNTHVFAGQGALEFQVMGLTAKQQAFIYTTMPPAASSDTRVIAHVYAPAGAPTLLATIYILDANYTWHSGPYLGLNPGGWTAVAYQIPANLQPPVRQLGVMILGVTGSSPYTGPLFLDTVDLQNP